MDPTQISASVLALAQPASGFVYSYNAGTTASDSLWAGLPVLTCRGESLAGRMAASLLTAIELPELITKNQTDFETLAIELAQKPQHLPKLRVAAYG